ncbi:hypothetical protein D9613_010672 [Agrocybe pediades]|uniref:Uncharacterized protein n=1 Tax=Agrocybe pediades TaxID=84607 RepID=A0A8H4VHI9_9AGAR|nr:hypothetical protein D9613_010672 [Agrocybe pediades]
MPNFLIVRSLYAAVKRVWNAIVGFYNPTTPSSPTPSIAEAQLSTAGIHSLATENWIPANNYTSGFPHVIPSASSNQEAVERTVLTKHPGTCMTEKRQQKAEEWRKKSGHEDDDPTPRIPRELKGKWKATPESDDTEQQGSQKTLAEG